MNTTAVAALFVDLAGKYDWRAISKLPDGEAQILLAIVRAAGFEPTQVVPRKLVGHFLDQDGSRTGDTFPINGLCPYAVMGRDGEDHYHATGWLDSVLRLAGRATDRQQLIEAVSA